MPDFSGRFELVQMVFDPAFGDANSLGKQLTRQSRLGFQTGNDFFLGSFLGSHRRFIDVFPKGRAIKAGDEQLGNLLELRARLFVQNERHPASPGLHHVDASQKFGHQGIAAFGDIALAELFDGQAFKQIAGIADLQLWGPSPFS